MEEINGLMPEGNVEYTEDNIRHLDDMSTSVSVRVCISVVWATVRKTTTVFMYC